jgi:multidrug efflux system membrane fusion protein
VKLRAIFPNQDNALFPSQFVNARLLVRTLHDVVLMPTPAIQHTAQEAFLYLLQPDQTVTMRTITVQVTDGNTSAVEGIKAGDEIASDNFNRLQEGTKVAPTEAPAAGSVTNQSNSNAGPP